MPLIHEDKLRHGLMLSSIISLVHFYSSPWAEKAKSTKETIDDNWGQKI